MSTYRPPIDDMQFLLHDVFKIDNPDLDRETCEVVLDEAAKLASDVLAPLNEQGDKHGAKLDGDKVITSPGFKEAYEQYCDGGWNALPFDPEYGGQGLPYSIAFPVQEMWQGSNMAFGLCPLLNQGAVEAINHHGSDEQKEFYLPKLISGEWTGTMNLTEPQAGSDLGLVRTKAVQDGDAYTISGQKIYITYGEHDMTDNIIHLVLARMEDAPDDVKGISLFIVPKFLEDGSHNGVRCIGLEHKLGIHGSPTCTMEFAQAKGFLVGEAHQGLKYMFTMMNNARLSVGLQGVAIAEAAYQHAAAYAADRVQGKSFTNGERVSIDQHADVKRMLLSMKSQIDAGRALTMMAAIAFDEGDKASVEILTPMVKSWCTDMAVEVASIGIQVHGGMGYIEETGAAQFLRDARILPIYEGTNGIQALDLAFRKTLKDGGVSVSAFFDQFKSQPQAGPYVDMLKEKITAAAKIGAAGNLDKLADNATPYLNAAALIAAGGVMEKKLDALAKCENASPAMKESAEFYMKNILPKAEYHLKTMDI